MSMLPWNPPLSMPTTPTPPAGGGLFAGLRYLLLSWRLSLWGMFLTFVGFALVPLTIRFLSALGVGFISYQLGSFALDAMFQQVQNYLTQIPPEAIAFASMAKIDEALSIVFAGLAARLSFLGFTSFNAGGKAKQMIWGA